MSQVHNKASGGKLVFFLFSVKMTLPEEILIFCWLLLFLLPLLGRLYEQLHKMVLLLMKVSNLL
jgi:hypothetical protein